MPLVCSPERNGHDKCRRLVEVYDHSQPTPWIEIASIETLSARRYVVFTNVGALHRRKDGIDVVEYLRSARAQMSNGAFVEDYATSIRIRRLTSPWLTSGLVEQTAGGSR